LLWHAGAEPGEESIPSLPGRHDIGIKLRDASEGVARVEFKGRTGTAGPVELPDGDEAPLERWTKWSSPVDAVPVALRALFEPAAEATLRRVRKDRHLRLVELVDGGGVVERRWDAGRIDRGAQLELAEIELEGARAWTVGLEAFPGDVSPEREFAPLARHLLTTLGGVPAGAVLCGYPAWLAEAG